VARVSDRDNGARALLKAIRDAQGTLKVGYVGDAGAKPAVDAPGLTVAELGEIHEFGLGTSPERSHIRATIDANAPQILAEIRKGATDIAKRRATSAQVLNRLGLFVVALIQRAMTNNIPPALSPRYAAAKAKKYPGRDSTLIASAQMLQSVTHRLAAPSEGRPPK
jgi:hypothetical protein